MAQKQKMNIQELVDILRQTGFETHMYIKNGCLEKLNQVSQILSRI